ncbi:glycosyltransferase family 4 protein [Anaerofustis sp.]|uniref:glycosyltransferase family 4 protein n=1 Tax=Anaerofustis sp. TaxID=1872517 RepID=UPI0025C39D86|nr:glycosyltransferase family 4 protein [Anaerofustis sp.]
MKIWILNHYATNMYFDGLGRHQSFAKYLMKKGHEVKIFCASTLHNSDEVIELNGMKYIEKKGKDDVPYVFVDTTKYSGNGKSRIKNMISYYKNVKKVVGEYISNEDKPDVIYASSVHPLALVAGIKLKNKFNIPCISEVRDLWPESLVEYGIIKRNSFIAKILYKGEKWIYKKSDAIIFTIPGGAKYIEDRKWIKDIPLDKVFYINNGVDLEEFAYNKKNYQFNDDDLENDDLFKIVYAGSIRDVNNVDEVIYMADIMNSKGYKNAKFIIYGDGPRKEPLEILAGKMSLDNVVFKGRVEKKYIPYILSKSDLNLISGISGNIGAYGVSWNKLFEYMASGKPISANYNLGSYNLIEDNKVGICKKYDDLKDYVEDIKLKIIEDKENYQDLCANAKRASEEFSFDKLTDKLIDVINSIKK